VYLVTVLGEAAEHSLHATAGAIKVHRVVNGKDIHPESMPVIEECCCRTALSDSEFEGEPAGAGTMKPGIADYELN